MMMHRAPKVLVLYHKSQYLLPSVGKCGNKQNPDKIYLFEAAIARESDIITCVWQRLKSRQEEKAL